MPLGATNENCHRCSQQRNSRLQTVLKNKKVSVKSLDNEVHLPAKLLPSIREISGMCLSHAGNWFVVGFLAELKIESTAAERFLITAKTAVFTKHLVVIDFWKKQHFIN